MDRNWKRIAAIALLAYAGLAVILYVATGFPDPSCGCLIKVTIFFSAMASPIIAAVGVFLFIKSRKNAVL